MNAVDRLGALHVISRLSRVRDGFIHTIIIIYILSLTSSSQQQSAALYNIQSTISAIRIFMFPMI